MPTFMKTRDNRLLRLIAIFKFFKAISLVAVGLAALHFLHDNDATGSITRMATRIGLSPGSRYLDEALAKLVNLPPRDVRDLGIGSFVYAALFLTEGIGLWLLQPWAEWFTSIITASLIPLEIYELHRHPTIGKVAILLLNVAVVVYLVLRIRRERHQPAAV